MENEEPIDSVIDVFDLEHHPMAWTWSCQTCGGEYGRCFFATSLDLWRHIWTDGHDKPHATPGWVHTELGWKHAPYWSGKWDRRALMWRDMTRRNRRGRTDCCTRHAGHHVADLQRYYHLV